MYRSYINEDGLKILLPHAIYEEVKVAINKFYPNECGGIFVGKITDGSTAVIEQMMLPKKFRSTPVFFVRVSEFLNTWLNKIFKESKGELHYLGEWHSHPNGSPFPSGTDNRAMQEISENLDIRIETPLLLIVGYDGAIYNEKFYIYKNNNLEAYKYE